MPAPAPRGPQGHKHHPRGPQGHKHQTPAASTPMPGLDPLRRFLVIGSAMLATMMVAVDTTIANVALPHIQSGMSASSEQVMWVLTSYLISSAIATPLSAWLASRYGRKFIMVGSVTGFTIASLACGASANLPELVLARFIQGACGAGLVPLSQAMMLDLTPPEKHGQAMASYGIASMFGPLIGPTLGGYITDTMSWRWCFLINLPVGLIAGLGLIIFMRKRASRAEESFDFFGFTTISVFLASFQLMLDRGQQLDWFDSPEIRIEALVMAVAGWQAMVHMFTKPDGFIRPQLFTDPNFAVGCLISATVGVISFAAVPMVTVMMQQSLGYTALLTGIVSSPRGIGTLLSMIVVGRVIGKVDQRILLIGGLSLIAVGLAMLAHLPLTVGKESVMLAGLFQGLGGGLTFVPLSVMVFATMPQSFRNEGTALYALTRNMGSSLGISFMQAITTQNTARVQSRLVEGVRPDNAMIPWAMPQLDFSAPHALAVTYAEIERQAVMVAYTSTFWLLCVLALAMLPVVLLMRPPRKLDSTHSMAMVD